MFWGLIMEPNKRYTQTVERSFHVSMASLDCSSAENEQIQIMLSVGKKNYLLCTLHPKNTIQAALDLNFQSGDEIAFMSNGKGHVHLTGYLVPEDDLSNLMEIEDEAEDSDVEATQATVKKSQKRKGQNNINEKLNKKSKLSKLLNSSFDEDENDSSFDVNNEVESDDDDDDDDDDDEDGDDNEDEDEDEDEDDDKLIESDDESEEDEDSEDEDSDHVPVVPKKKGVQEKSSKMAKQKVNQNGASEKPPKNEHVKAGNKTPKNNKEQQNKNEKGQGGTPFKGAKSPKEEKTPKSQKKNNPESGVTPQKKTIEGGVFIEDLKVGNGPVAKSGKMVQVYYEGRLKSNNKVFDSTTQGNGFAFRLGKREVIRGWDVGVAGMRVGGKRKITCPPPMAYGAKGSPPVIPPNSTLVFEVELKNIN